MKSPELADWFRPGFSTTTEKDEVCAAATATASLQAYFEYTMMCMCGIPSVTLMGTVGDWKLLRDRAPARVRGGRQSPGQGHADMGGVLAQGVRRVGGVSGAS
ncbi:unnamed protein product [Ectocarpus sp. 12 AP-2014]